LLGVDAGCAARLLAKQNANPTQQGVAAFLKQRFRAGF
jgi:hypothetical protein